MESTSKDTTAGRFEEFVRLRKIGYTSEDAWQHVKQEAGGIAADDANELLVLIRNWEAREGCLYKPAPSDDPYSTQFTPPPGWAQMRATLRSSKPPQG